FVLMLPPIRSALRGVRFLASAVAFPIVFTILFYGAAVTHREWFPTQGDVDKLEADMLKNIRGEQGQESNPQPGPKVPTRAQLIEARKNYKWAYSGGRLWNVPGYGYIGSQIDFHVPALADPLQGFGEPMNPAFAESICKLQDNSDKRDHQFYCLKPSQMLL